MTLGAVLLVGCSLTTSLTGFSGGAAEDAGATPEAGLDGGATGTGSRIYVAGGRLPGDTDLRDVVVGDVLEDGTIGSWRAMTSLPDTWSYAPSFVVDGAWFLIGGVVGGDRSSSIARTRLDGSGDLTWETLSGFTAGRYRHGAAYADGHLYVVGGSGNADMTLQDTQRASFANRGFGAFAPGPALPQERSRAAVAATSKMVYVIGGRAHNSSTPSDAIFGAVRNGDGSLQPWVTAGALPSAREHARVNVHGDHLVVTGGDSPSGELRDVVVCDLGTAGEITRTRTTTPLPFARYVHGAVVVRGRLYVVGGLDDSAQPTADVAFAPVDDDGAVGAWRATTPLPARRAYASVVAY